jgi:hypothetical protein
MTGGGFGIFNGCTAEWGTPSGGWGAQYGGVSSRSQCDSFPAALQQGCYWRFDWFQNADNPSVTFKQVECPAALTAKSGCVRADDAIPETPTGASVVPTYSGTASTTSIPGTSTTSSGSGGSTSSPGGTVQKWGQCGGQGWTGGTVCVANTTCIVSNPYFSQCL